MGRTKGYTFLECKQFSTIVCDVETDNASTACQKVLLKMQIPPKPTMYKGKYTSVEETEKGTVRVTNLPDWLGISPSTP